MKTHIVAYGAYYYAELVGSKQRQFYSNLVVLQYRTAVGDLFIPQLAVRKFPTRLEAYRWMFHNIKDLHSSRYPSRRICYSYARLAHILSKLYPEDFI